MTDLELIALLQEKSAGELTPAEVDAIRARWTQSPELRQALVDHLQLESRLIGGLSPVHLDVDTILQRAANQKPPERESKSSWVTLIGLSLLLVAGAALFVFFSRSNERQTIVENSPPSLAPSEDLPADALLPSNSQEPSADTALDVAIGDKPVETPVAKAAPDPQPKAAFVEIAANEPWSAGLARDVAPWAADSPKLTYDYKSSGHDEFPEAQAKRWFASVDGHQFDWSNDTISNPPRRMTKFQGMAKLRAPWPDDAVLRLTPFEITDLTLYFWRGPTGVALRFYTRREPHLWAAFEISRENSSPKPSRYGLLTTDSGSYSRSTPGTVDIRQQDGQLVLARGGLILLSVPFGGTPLEVYLEGQFRFRGLSMYRSAPFKSRADDEHPSVMAGNAANLPWAISAESPSSMTEQADGTISISAESQEKASMICLPFGWLQATKSALNSTGLFEVIVQVDSADPGTGIYLGDRNGRPLQQLAFFKDTATQQTTFGILRPGENRIEANYNPVDFPPPYLAKSAWFKLVAGLGTLHIQTSGDGTHWGHVVESPGRDLPGSVGSMGLFTLPGAPPRTIRIRTVQVRELTGITSLANPDLRSRVPAFENREWNDAAWTHRVLDSQPMEVDTESWFTTSAVVALSQGPPKGFGLNLLRQLLTVVMQSNRSFGQKRRMLDDASLLCDTFDDSYARMFGTAYEELGWQLAESGDPDALEKIRSVLLWSPIWTNSKMRNVWERLHSREILNSIYRHNWSETWKFAQSAGFWNMPPHPDQRPQQRGDDLDRHARWAKALVGEVAPQVDNGTAGAMPIGLRHPLIPVLNKEAYNVRAELQSALSGQNYEDAGRIVMSITELDSPGLLPDPDDRQLYVSMSTAIANDRRAHPGFAQTMKEKFEALGQIRIQSAMNRHDFAALQGTTLQFMGTDAARTAHKSLGEIALSVGQFDLAEQHFNEALIDASPQWKEILQPRQILASALGGRLSPAQLPAISTQLPTQPIELNGTTVSATEFQAMISDLATRSSSGGSLVETSDRAELPFPLTACKLEPRSQFDGHPGNNPGRAEFRFADAFGRQLAVTADSQRIYVSNRFQVNAYSVSDGQQLWAQGLGSEQGEAYALPFTPMKPLVVGDRLFVRRLTKAGAELACLKAENGQVLWNQRPSHSVVSDPVIWDSRLFALTLSKADEEFVQLESTWFDSLSGKVTRSRPLFRLRDGIDRQFSGTLAIRNRIAVCTVAGTIASFNSQGEMRWLRRETMLQKPVDELIEDSRIAAPIIQSDRVIVSTPGVRQVGCYDLDSGAILWEKPVSNLRGLVCATETRVLLDTTSGLVALNVESGEVAWRRPLEFRLEALNTDGKTLTITRRVTFLNNKSRPVLMGIDLETGEELGQSLVSIDERDEVQMGPMFCAGGKWWSFVGQTWKEPRRELCQLTSIPTATPKPFENEVLGRWNPPMNDARFSEIESVVPGWFPAADYHDRLAFVAGDQRGESQLLVSKIDGAFSVRLISRMHLVASRKHLLRLRVGNQPGQKWKLVVRTSHRNLLDKDIEDAGNTNGWRDLTVDLSQFAGQDLTLQLIQTSVNQAVAEALLKRVELLVE